MTDVGNKKQMIIELALQNKPPSEIRFELKKQGQDANMRYIWKTLSEARRDGLSILRFNRDEPKKAAAVERSAKLGTLSEARLARRREVAGYYLKGFEPAEIIANGFAPPLDALEIIELCRDLEPIRPPGQWLTYLKRNGHISQESNNMQDAASQLVKRINSLTDELDKSQNECHSLKTSNAQLEGDLKRAKDEGESHREAHAVASGNYDKLLRGSAMLQALVAKNGLERTQTLLDRASNVEPLERRLGDLERQIRIRENGLIAMDAERSEKRQETEDWCDNVIKETETKVNLVVKLSGITKGKLDTVDSAAHLLATDLDYLAGIVRKMSDDMIRRMASRLSYEENKRLWNLLMVESAEKYIGNVWKNQGKKYPVYGDNTGEDLLNGACYWSCQQDTGVRIRAETDSASA